MGFVRKNLGVDLTGGGTRDAIEQGTQAQVQAGEDALNMIRGDLSPFADFGESVLGDLEGSFLSNTGIGMPTISTPNLATSFDAPNLVGAIGSRNLTSGDLDILSPDFGLPSTQQFTADTDPNRVLNNPFFQALQEQQSQGLINQQAALGRGGSGETNDLLTQNLLLLGNEFQQQDIAQQEREFGLNQSLQQQDFLNRLGLGETIFGQQLSANEQDLQRQLSQFGIDLSANELQRLVQQQQFGLDLGASQAGNDALISQFQLDRGVQQSDFDNQLLLNQAKFNQLFDAARLGQSSAAQTGTTGASILQNIGNAQSAGAIANAGVSNPLADMILSGGLGAAAGSAGLLGSTVGAGGGAILGLLSDVSLKDNIEYVETVDGVDYFSWDWNEEIDQPTYGVLAQDIMVRQPEAVYVGDDGYYRVDYGVINGS